MDTLLEHLENEKQLYATSESTLHLLQAIDWAGNSITPSLNSTLYSVIALHPPMKYGVGNGPFCGVEKASKQQFLMFR